jgi:hypothetical protein
MLVAAWITGVATGSLAILAGVTAWYARKAFNQQAEELRVLQKQASDQADMLAINNDQLDYQARQFDEQKNLNARQTEVLELQAQELRESLGERKRNADDQRRSRAAFVFVTANYHAAHRPPDGVIGASRDPVVEMKVHNTGSQPVYDVRVHWVDAAKGSQAGGESVLGTIVPGWSDATRRDLPDGTAPEDFIPVVYFRDAALLRWTLLPDGQLDEVDPGLPAGAPAIATTAVARARLSSGADLNWMTAD